MHHRGDDAVEQVRDLSPQLLILDLDLPGVDGREIARTIRGDPHLSELPILMMTGFTAEEDRVEGFELGADDYLPKPVSYRELALRVRALLRRTVGTGPPNKIEMGRLALDLDRKEVRVDGDLVDVTSTEFRLLWYLAEHTGQVLSRAQLLENVWGTRGDLTTRRVDTYVQRLRQKLGPVSEYLQTRRGHGYQVEVPAG